MAHGTFGVGISDACRCRCTYVSAGEAPLEAPQDYLNHTDDILEIEGPVALPVVGASDGEVMAISEISPIAMSLEDNTRYYIVTEALVNLYEILVALAISFCEYIHQRVAEFKR
eukprot:1009610_1